MTRYYYNGFCGFYCLAVISLTLALVCSSLFNLFVRWYVPLLITSKNIFELISISFVVFLRQFIFFFCAANDKLIKKLCFVLSQIADSIEKHIFRFTKIASNFSSSNFALYLYIIEIAMMRKYMWILVTLCSLNRFFVSESELSNRLLIEM